MFLGKANRPLTGFTIVELLVSMAIMVLLLSISFINWREIQGKLALERAANELAQDIRRVEEISILSEANQKCADQHINGYKYGYGILFEATKTTSYTIFADCDGNNFYNSDTDASGANDNIITPTAEFNNNIEISNINPPDSNSLTIVFNPPDPEIKFNDNIDTTVGSASITLKLKGTEITKIITINKRGLVTIE